VERLLDQALREVAQPPAPDLKPRVMAAWDARLEPGPKAESGRARWRAAPAFLKPATVLAGTLAIFLGVFLVWQYTDVLFRRADRLARESGAARATEQRRPTASASGTRPLDPVRDMARTGVGPLAGEQAAAGPHAARGRTRRTTVTVLFPAEEPASSPGPHLPGAPAGQLGDPIEPLPRTPGIWIAPIVPARTISEMSRPVSEFPAGNHQPASGKPEAGTTEGEHR
jgi:hypothetical protein